MSWLIAILIGVLCGVAGAALTMAASDSIIRLFRISTFEGAAGYLVVFVLVPLGFIVGLIAGIVIMRVNAPVGTPAILLNTGLAVLVTTGLLTAGYGTAYIVRARKEHVPQLPTAMALHMEIRYRPLADRVPRDELIRASLFASDKDNAFVEIDPTRSEERDGWVVFTCEAPLRSKSATRIFSLSREGEAYQVFQLPLAAVPSQSDSAWSDWMPARPPLGKAEQTLDPAKACELRYRVVAR